MLAFGTDTYLYVGVGDGGGSFDNPPTMRRTQHVLLGKMLRIDVDHPDAVNGTLYSSPATNPLVGQPGRDEIFAWGFRNPGGGASIA
jgi:glucose/arabinose dehydrogenase